jgi:hypothetical protein
MAARFVAAGWLMVVAGCGSGESGRLPVTGRVAGNGALALDGSISFIPAKGNDGMGATCALKGGVYGFDRSNGPTAGAFDVSIRRSPSKPTDGQASSLRQEWNFKAEIPAGGPYTQDFTLD